jgi:hypothetical protein
LTTPGITLTTAGKALGKSHEALGRLPKSKPNGGVGQEIKKDEAENEQVRLRLDFHNMDIEVQLKGKIHVNLTLGPFVRMPTIQPREC